MISSTSRTRAARTSWPASSHSTASAATVINGSTLTVPAALGNKLIHPWCNFLLHNIGTGDGKLVLPGPGYAIAAQQIRTAQLNGLKSDAYLRYLFERLPAHPINRVHELLHWKLVTEVTGMKIAA